MPLVEGLIFDWGNTLVDYPLRTLAQQLEFLSSFLVDQADLLAGASRVDVKSAAGDPAWLEAFNAENPNFAVRPFRQRMRMLLRDDAESMIVEELERRLCQRIFGTGMLIDGAADLLAQARQSVRRLCVLSNTPWGTAPAQWRAELARYDFTRACDAIVLCGDVGYRKPHRDAFHHCLQVLGTSPSATVMVGDSLASDVLGAKHCGLTAVWFDRHRSANPDRHLAVDKLTQVIEAIGR